ncbi:nuclear pore complex protein Nup153-like isoform X1 [Anser cygnoides]|uniref:nuclear pore complex protein Nup153-like isoform X1 n=1 Tax=Anser cygnoides TaxID=8845 RepID=UPI0034D269E9
MVNCLVCLTEGPTPVTSSSASAFSAPSGEFLDLDKFKKPEGSWDWETCLVQNKAEATKCVACESAKPSTKAELKECSGAESAAASQFILGRTEEKQDSVTTAAPRGYAYVRFGEQGDQMRALQDCQNAPGLGGKGIRLSIGISKRLKAELQRYQSYNYNDYCQDYQNYHSQRSYDAYADYNYSSYAPYDSMQAVGDCSLGDSLMAPAVFEESSVMTAIGDDLITDGNKGSIIVT